MKTNSNTQIFGSKVVLVPYREEHVQKYHSWMKSVELQHLTGSEPLTIEEEYAMQRAWCEDDNKCTFIVLDRNHFNMTNNQIDSMIGDTNLYFNDPEEPHTAECEIMIAETKSRSCGMGWESIILMLRYGIDLLHVTKYRAKIKIDNEPSINMFQKLQFIETSRSDVFQEITLDRSVDKNWTEWLELETHDSSRREDQLNHQTATYEDLTSRGSHESL